MFSASGSLNDVPSVQELTFDLLKEKEKTLDSLAADLIDEDCVQDPEVEYKKFLAPEQSLLSFGPKKLLEIAEHFECGLSRLGGIAHDPFMSDSDDKEPVSVQEAGSCQRSGPEILLKVQRPKKTQN